MKNKRKKRTKENSEYKREGKIGQRENYGKFIIIMELSQKLRDFP